jgi:AraC family transcriptional regulator
LHKVEFSRIFLQSDKLLVGIAAKMSMASDATPKLWQRFMPRRKEIQNAVEVASRNSVPDEMKRFVLRGGHFAVFDHCGPPSEFPKTLNFIFSQWLPQSEWQLDDREHFEMLLPGWRADDLNAREEVWIPVKSNDQ